MLETGSIIEITKYLLRKLLIKTLKISFYGRQCLPDTGHKEMLIMYLSIVDVVMIGDDARDDVIGGQSCGFMVI